MPGRTIYEAAGAFLDPIARALGCLGVARLYVSPGGRAVLNREHVWFVNEANSFALSNGLKLKATMRYEIVPYKRGNEAYRASTRGYMYSLCAPSGPEILAAHWHPSGSSSHHEPHWHLGAAAIGTDGVWSPRTHLPSPRVAFEEMIRQAVLLGAEPTCEDWEERLSASENSFREHRSWHESPPPE